MPSPIAHAAMGYAIYRLQTANKPERAQPRLGPFPHLLLFSLALSQLPDLDFIPGIFLPGQFDQYHNTISHSPLMGLGVAILVGLGGWLWQRTNFWYWFVFALLCYETHIIMDYFTVGRGVMLLWPFTTERFEPSFKLFYGLHRSDGWVSIRHVWTFITEAGFAALLTIMVHAATNRQATNQSD